MAVIKLRSSVTIELGVWGGRSCIPLALAHREQGHGIVYAVDPWSREASIENQNEANAGWWGSVDHESVYRQFMAHLKAQGLEEYVKVIRQRSDDFTPPDVVDFVHVDANHSDQAIRDVERYCSKVRAGGFVFADDIKWEGGGVERAVEKLLTMGFVKIFDRDTGAMFQRVPKPTAIRKKRVVKKVKKGSVRVSEA